MGEKKEASHLFQQQENGMEVEMECDMR